jgi:HK97 family phage major capsid protein
MTPSTYPRGSARFDQHGRLPALAGADPRLDELNAEAARLRDRAEALGRIRDSRPWSADERAEADQVAHRGAEIRLEIAKTAEERAEARQALEVLEREAAHRGGAQHSGYRPDDQGAGERRGLRNALVLERSDSFAAWQRENAHRVRGADRYTADEIRDFSLGRAVRAMATGNWTEAELERRAMNEGTDSQGGFLTPEVLSGPAIDRVRAAARVTEAGATIVPVLSDKHSLPRLATGVAGTWRAEASAVNQDTPGFERVTFAPKTLAVLVKLSFELAEDMAPQSEGMIENEIFQALGLQLDLAALRGSGTSNQPQGIRNQSGVTIQSLGANGATPTNWDPLVDAVAGVEGRNITPDAAILAPRSEQTLAKLKDTTNQPLQPPDYVRRLPRLTSNQIPLNLTQGTSTDTSEIYVGRWADCLIGLRGGIGVRMKTLDQRFADTMEIGLLAWIRADIQLAHPESFQVVTGVRP